ncbi:vWA domain-containing protein [Halorientalis salina]|uniref:vWA domain-containing protein n=1 Tax=Halorientalis salina TaxID=2932266 RepID=UPI0010ACCE8F|nr:VWA domain-containing protein [Halorientalis salina]
MPSPFHSEESATGEEQAVPFEEPPRRADRRRAHLDRLAKISTSTSIQVRLGDHTRNRRLQDGHRIDVPSDPIEQSVSDLSPPVWHLVEQETLTFHGIGHLRWTDFDAYRRYSEQCLAIDRETAASGPDLAALYRFLFNAGEDACIDAFLDSEFDLRDELILSYENLVAPVRERHCLNAVEAIGFGLLDHGFYDSGVWQSVLDGDIGVVDRVPEPDAGRLSAFVGGVVASDASVGRFDDRIESLMAEAVTEPDGTERAELFFEFAQHVHESLSDAEVPETGIRSDFSVGIGQQATPNAARSTGRSSGTDSPDGRGETERSGDRDAGDEDRDATELLEDLCDGSDGDTDEPERTPDGETDEQERAPDDDRTDRDTAPDHDPVTFETYTSVDTDEYEDTLEEHRQATRRDRNRGDDATGEKQVTHSFSGLDDGITVPTDWSRTDITINEINECERQAQSIARILRATLQQERTSSRRYGTERGRLESSQLPYAVTGRRNVRSEMQDSDEKAYSVQFVLDRSISMRGSAIKHAQRAVYQLGLGLSTVGVDVSLLSVYRNIPHLEVPFGADISTHRNRLFSAKTRGGTPLSHCLAFAQSELLDGEFDNHLILVVTDGYPDHEEAYRECVASLSVPVYGVYIDESTDRHGDHDKYFDSVRYATPETIDDRCRELCYDFVNHVG